jgi:hypothetical protein
VDPNGMLIFANGDGVNDGISLMNGELSFSILRDEKTGQLSVPDGTKGKNDAENVLIEAINNQYVTLNLAFTAENTMNDMKGFLQQVIGGMYGGSQVNEDGSTIALQGINIEHFKKVESAGGDKVGQNIIHETLEGYVGGRDHPGTSYTLSYEPSHGESMRLYPLSGQFKLNDKRNPSFIDRSGRFNIYVNGVFLYILPAETSKVIISNSDK